MDAKLTLSDISEKLIEKRIPPELLDNIYLHLDYSTLCTLNLTNKQWHSAYKRFVILPYNDKEDYHKLFLWWTNKTRKPFEVIHKCSYASIYKLEDHKNFILTSSTDTYKIIYPYKGSYRGFKYIDEVKITDDLPFQAYKNLTDVFKNLVIFDYELTDENKEELKKETKTTYYITLRDNNLFIRYEVTIYIAYFHINHMKIKVISMIINNLPIISNMYNGLDTVINEYSNFALIFPYQYSTNCTFVYEEWSSTYINLYVPSMTTMDYNSDDLMFVQLRDILHKEITDRTLMFGHRWQFF